MTQNTKVCLALALLCLTHNSTEFTTAFQLPDLIPGNFWVTEQASASHFYNINIFWKTWFSKTQAST